MLLPERLFARIYRNLRPRDLLVPVNHGAAEAAIERVLRGLRGYCAMQRAWRRGRASPEPGTLSAHRASPASVSCWARV